MSWQKQAAAVGLAGLSTREAALGALYCEQFQLMPDPLARVKKRGYVHGGKCFIFLQYNVDIVETRKEFNTTVCTCRYSRNKERI